MSHLENYIGPEREKEDSLISVGAYEYFRKNLIHELAEEYRGTHSHTEGVRGALFDEKVEVPKRTVAMADFAIRELIKRLKKENSDIKKNLDGTVPAQNINGANLKEQLIENEMLLEVLETNCMKTLGPVTDSMISRSKEDLSGGINL